MLHGYGLMEPAWPVGRRLPDAGRRACRTGGRAAHDRTPRRPAQAITPGADKAYDAQDFVNKLRSMNLEMSTMYWAIGSQRGDASAYGLKATIPISLKIFSLRPDDIQALIILLLVLSGEAGAAFPTGATDEVRPTLSLHLDSVSIGETENGETVLQLDIGRTTLAFLLTDLATRMRGQALLTASATPATGSG